MEKSNYPCFPYCYRKAFECLESLLMTLIELFKKFYSCIPCELHEERYRREKKVQSVPVALETRFYTFSVYEILEKII